MVSITSAVPRQGLVELKAASEDPRKPFADFSPEGQLCDRPAGDHEPAAQGPGLPPQGRSRVRRVPAPGQGLARPPDGVLPSLEVDATWSEAPDYVAPAPPTRADWFAPKDKAPRGTVFYVHGGLVRGRAQPADRPACGTVRRRGGGQRLCALVSSRAGASVSGGGGRHRRGLALATAAPARRGRWWPWPNRPARRS